MARYRKRPRRPKFRRYHRRRVSRIFRAIAGAAAGVVVAIPASYLIQPGIVRGLYNITEYCEKVLRAIPKAGDGGDLLGCGHRVVMTAVVLGAIGGALGYVIGRK